MSIRVSLAALACGAFVALRPVSAHAQSSTVVVPPPPAPVVAERSVVPNPTLLGSGVGTFVVGYAPSVVVGIVSDHKGDDNLFIPVVGPWLDLGKRDCSGATVLTSDGPFELASRSNCGTSDIERAALIASGVVQGAGVLQMLGSLFVPQRRVDVVARAAGRASGDSDLLPRWSGSHGVGTILKRASSDTRLRPVGHSGIHRGPSRLRWRRGCLTLVSVERREKPSGEFVSPNTLRVYTSALKLLFRQAPGAFWTTDRNLMLTAVVGREGDVLGVSPEDLVGKTIQEFVGTDDPSDPAIARRTSPRWPDFRARSATRSGRRFYEARVEPLRDGGDEIVGTVGVALNVTESAARRGRARGEPRAPRRGAARSPTWGAGRGTSKPNVVAWSDELYRIYAVDPTEFRGTTSRLREPCRSRGHRRGPQRPWARRSADAGPVRVQPPDPPPQRRGADARDSRGRRHRPGREAPPPDGELLGRHRAVEGELGAREDGVAPASDARGDRRRHSRRRSRRKDRRPEPAIRGPLVRSRLAAPNATTRRLLEVVHEPARRRRRSSAARSRALRHPDGRELRHPAFQGRSRVRALLDSPEDRRRRWWGACGAFATSPSASGCCGGPSSWPTPDACSRRSTSRRRSRPWPSSPCRILGDACAVDLAHRRRRVAAPLRRSNETAGLPIRAELPRAVLAGHSLVHSVDSLSYMSVPLPGRSTLFGVPHVRRGRGTATTARRILDLADELAQPDGAGHRERAALPGRAGGAARPRGVPLDRGARDPRPHHLASPVDPGPAQVVADRRA